MIIRKLKIEKLAVVIAYIFILLISVSYQTYADDVSGKKKVYLTFDDGPIPVITEKILNVLREQKVNATFFVVGKEIPGREYILKRIYDEGNSIGLHTYSHKFKKIYYDEDTFIDEMVETRKKISEVIHMSASAVRFPGGSSKHLTIKLLNKLHSNNMQVYDWNVDLYDGRKENISVNKIIKNSKNIKPQYSRIIILAHCNSNNLNTVKALPEIIKFYKTLNYEFDTITEHTEEYYYRVK